MTEFGSTVEVQRLGQCDEKFEWCEVHTSIAKNEI